MVPFQACVEQGKQHAPGNQNVLEDVDEPCG
jgi:hypothetical protein